ncbi:MAG: thioesterase domain-containing protein [Nitrospinota bacterium]|nr:thioesterase domain-containing protein [Nitrospinota bacterium]
MKPEHEKISRELEEVMQAEIPMAKAMGIGVKSYDGTTLKLCAPLEPNINHKKTAFGGSIYSIMVLSGWGLLWMKIKENDLQASVVITKSETGFMKPIDGEISAVCTVDINEINLLIEKFSRNGRAKINLSSKIYSGETVAATFTGTYAALSSK